MASEFEAEWLSPMAFPSGASCQPDHGNSDNSCSPLDLFQNDTSSFFPEASLQPMHGMSTAMEPQNTTTTLWHDSSLDFGNMYHGVVSPYGSNMQQLNLGFQDQGPVLDVTDIIEFPLETASSMTTLPPQLDGCTSDLTLCEPSYDHTRRYEVERAHPSYGLMDSLNFGVLADFEGLDPNFVAQSADARPLSNSAFPNEQNAALGLPDATNHLGAVESLIAPSHDATPRHIQPMQTPTIPLSTFQLPFRPGQRTRNPADLTETKCSLAKVMKQRKPRLVKNVPPEFQMQFSVQDSNRRVVRKARAKNVCLRCWIDKKAVSLVVIH